MKTGSLRRPSRIWDLAWKTSDAGPAHGVFSQPIVSNGLVYWGSFDGYERATDMSGNLLWQTNLGTTSPPGCTDPSEAGVASTATVTTDVPVGTATSVLYVGGGDAKVYALNAATGAVLWSYDGRTETRTISSGRRRPCSATVSISVSLRSVTAPAVDPGSTPSAQPGHRCAAEHL